jgi:putative hemolysin
MCSCFHPETIVQSWPLELCVIFLLALLNGFFAAAEIAILTARRGRLEQLAENGDAAAKVALSLAKDTDRFLPTVQVGITLVGTIASAFAGAHLKEPLEALLVSLNFSWITEQSSGLAFSLVVCGVAYLQLIVGELVPKRIAFQNAEHLARFVAYPMLILQRASQPAIWVLKATTRLVLTILGQRADQTATVSVEDIQHLIDAGTKAGLLEESEQKVAKEALRLGDRTVAEILRPRIDIDALDLETPATEVVGALAMSGFSRIPVYEGTIDHIVGFIYLKDVFLQQHLNRPIELRRMIRPPLFIPKSITITRLLELFREHKTQLAIVLDEYGGTQGMVTLEDVLEMLVGDIHDELRHRQDEHRHRQDGEAQVPNIVRRENGSLSVAGSCNLHELESKLDISRWTEPVPRGVGTVSGLMLSLLKRPPQIGDVMRWNDLRLEIVDMDDSKIDRLLIHQQSDRSETAPEIKADD